MPANPVLKLADHPPGEAMPIPQEAGGAEVGAALLEPSLLISAPTLGRLLNVSEATLWRWDSGGRLPRGIKLGGVKRWSRAEILAWVEHGCPARKDWENIKTAGLRSGRR